MSVNVNASAKAIRAIGSELAWRIVKPMIIGGIIVAVLLLAFGGWLTTLHALWWILEAIFIAYTVLFILLVVIVRLLFRVFTPESNNTQRKAVKQFADKLQRVADAAGISRFVLLFRIAKQLLAPSQQNFIKQIAEDSTSLHTDLLAVIKTFE